MKTDAQLKADVVSELNWEPSVNSDEIGVEVKAGVVTLAGHVDSYAEKLSAEHAAQRVSGVRALAVEMDVRLPGPSQRTDAEIGQAARNALEWSTYMATSKIQVLVQQGWVTLSGEVEWAYQRQAANSAIRSLRGVKGVSDTIVLKSAVSAAGVKADIEAALKRRATDDAKNIFVEVNGSDVVLSGTTDTWMERSLVSDSAWTTAGVHRVVNNILVV
ncbi:MAG: BON domain-containing protein [Rhodanobacter sp.]